MEHWCASTADKDCLQLLTDEHKINAFPLVT